MATRNRITVNQSQRLSLNARLLDSIRLLSADAIGLTRFLEEAAAGNPALVVEPPPVSDWMPRWRDAFARAPRCARSGTSRTMPSRGWLRM